MSRTVLIFGIHPLRDNLQDQFQKKGMVVRMYPEYSLPQDLPFPEECVILPPAEGNGAAADGVTQRFLLSLAQHWKDYSSRRPLIHLLLREPSTLRIYQLSDFPAFVNEVFEVWPFTLEEAWARQVIVRFPGLVENPYPALDRKPIPADSRQFVHLVIAGFDSFAQSIAIHAAQCAHFPNYNGKASQPLRTRITVVSNAIDATRDAFIAQYRQLFDHSFYRSIYPNTKSSELHHPVLEGTREDFVDIEWEFVEGSLSHPVVAERLGKWAKDTRRQLTLVLSETEDAANTATAMSLPEGVYDNAIPVWVRMRQDLLTGTVSQNPRFRNLIPFGMEGSGYDVRLPAARMSRLLHFFYSYSYAKGHLPTAFPKEAVERAWRQAGSLKMRLSNVWNAMTMATKLHSLGHQAHDLATFYALSAEETEVLSRTEHHRWNVERLLSGTRPCTEEERASIRADISLKNVYKKERDAHYDLCAYDELGTDAQGNDVRLYDRALTACIPLIVESYLKEEKGR